MPKDLRWNAATLWASAKYHIFYYPLKGGDVFNFIVTYHNDVTEAVAGGSVDKEDVFRGIQYAYPMAQ